MESTSRKAWRVSSWQCTHQNIPTKLTACSGGYTTKSKLCNSLTHNICDELPGALNKAYVRKSRETLSYKKNS